MSPGLERAWVAFERAKALASDEGPGSQEEDDELASCLLVAGGEALLSIAESLEILSGHAQDG